MKMNPCHVTSNLRSTNRILPTVRELEANAIYLNTDEHGTHEYAYGGCTFFVFCEDGIPCFVGKQASPRPFALA